jgi:hypothetical protein
MGEKEGRQDGRAGRRIGCVTGSMRRNDGALQLAVAMRVGDKESSGRQHATTVAMADGLNGLKRLALEKAGRSLVDTKIIVLNRLLSPAEVSVDNVRGGLSPKFVDLFFLPNPIPPCIVKGAAQDASKNRGGRRGTNQVGQFSAKWTSLVPGALCLSWRRSCYHAPEKTNRKGQVVGDH